MTETNTIGKDLIGRYVIVRCVHSGVFAGTLKNFEGTTVELENVRRIYWWEGASTCSELAVNGTSKPDSCKFPVEMPHQIVTDAKEIIETTEKAEQSIKGVKVWTSHP